MSVHLVTHLRSDSNLRIFVPDYNINFYFSMLHFDRDVHPYIRMNV